MPESNCKNNGHWAITLSNDVKEIPLLTAFVEKVCEFNNLDEQTSMQLNLALEEAVVNVMSYAYPEGTKGYVDIKAESDETCMKFIITDRGTPFDPTTKEEVDTTLPIEIFLVRKMMDAIEYEYKDGQNILTLKKKNK